MLKFILGLIVGTISGVTLMCLFQINRYEEDLKNGKI